MIFRRPYFVGQRYILRVQLYRRDNDIVALGAFDEERVDSGENAARAAVYLRFEGKIF